MERTFIIIKPDAVAARHAGRIIQRIFHTAVSGMGKEGLAALGEGGSDYYEEKDCQELQTGWPGCRTAPLRKSQPGPKGEGRDMTEIPELFMRAG